MILLYLIVAMPAIVSCVDYTPELSEYIFDPFLPIVNQLNVVDGIPITNATTTPTVNRLPTKDQMTYYVYYIAVNWYYDVINDFNCKYCLKIRPDIAHRTALFNDTFDTFAMVTLSHTRQEIVVAFRGSSNSMNLFLDFGLPMNVRVNDASNIKVHTGFYLATMSLYARVVGAIEFYRKNTGYKIVITGLSLGGAIARMTCFFLNDRKQFPGAAYELYTFGEFRVGNIPFAEYMNSLLMTSVRVVHRADIIPHLPPVNVLGLPLLWDHYVHCQTEYWIHGEEAQRFCNQNTYEDPTCSISIGPAYTLVDHLTYFDVSIGSAFAQPLQLATIGFKILPVELIAPPLPKYIENPLGAILEDIVGIILPIFG
ncbi:lipase-like [Bradysia coprophila]|uniref:lipase-like n=1 Tax=Bradysia coprophila TaxID=38358 RepID=UPI00187D8DA6|nr:lipase-like [Bradysia coprophila]